MTDYAAWLVEIVESSGPVYFQMHDDDDWTKDHDKALHFARRESAQQVIDYYGWTRAAAVEHCWPAPTVREVIAESNGHHWITFASRGSGSSALICCRDCGIVRRADDKNSPCRGAIQVGPRNGSEPHPPI